MEMSESLKKRTAARGWVTKTCTTVHEAVDQNKGSLEVDQALRELEKKLEKLDLVQEAYELEVAVEDLTQEIDTAADFRVTAERARMAALKYLQVKTTDSDIEVASVRSEKSAEVKLPKLELPKFKGDPLNWVSFWDQFNAIINNSDMPCVNKFTYLISLLDGEAKQVIDGLTLTEANYNVACELLHKRYGRKELIVFSHVQALLQIVPLSHKSNVREFNSELRKLYDKLIIVMCVALLI
jgi:hypothetical protein